ncbi:MAG: signal peptidase I, partial [Acidimicrobiales bacterium]
APAPSDRVVHDAAALAALPPSTAGLVLGGELDAETADEAADEAELSTTRTVLEWCAVLAGALVVALVLKSFLFQAFLIPSESMTPTLEVSDRVLVNKLSYRLHGVERGDVVVFRRPPSEVVEGGPNDDLIKRVVGLPGDMVEIRDSSVFVNGQKLDEPYLAESLRYSDPNGETVHRVAEHEVFVMGDNRSNSRDSRFFGPIDQDLIVGRAFLKVWPPSSIELL